MHLCLLLMLLTSSIHADGNVVANPGFETGTEDGKQPAVWGLPALPGVEFAWDNEVRHAGERSGRIAGIDPEKQSRFVQAWRQDVQITPGVPVWFSVWIKGQDLTSGRINILHKDPKGEVLRNQGISSFDGTFDWREFAGSIDPEPGTVGLQLVIGLQKSTGIAWFDDVSVAPMKDGADEFGTIDMTVQGQNTAGAILPARFQVKLGERGLRTGGAISLRYENWRPAREFNLRDFELTCTEPGAKFDVRIPPRKTSWPPTPKPIAAVATLTDGGPLKAGTLVTISAQLRLTPFTNVKVGMTGLISPAEGSASYPLAGTMELSAQGGPAARLMCMAQGRPIVGQPGRVTLAATDENGNPAGGFRGTVELACNADVGLPARYTFTEADAGSHVFAPRFPAETVCRVKATCGEMTATSNPILARRPDEPGIFFGDIHSHSRLSADGVGEPDLAYDHARRFLGLDFAGLADHSPRGPMWREAVDVCNQANDPGNFASIVGFEWSDSRRGHRNAYYRGDDGPEQPGLADNMQSWWDYLDEQGVPVLTVPHHPNTEAAQIKADGEPAWGPMDWSLINHRYQRVVEICQTRGSFEVPGGPLPELRVVRKDVGSSVQTALAQGHRLGFIGSTDTHSGRPGNGPARAAVISPQLTREALWDGMHARTCYASTGAHILVFFTVNGNQMGSEVVLGRADEPREVVWRAVGTGPVSRVDLLRNNEVAKSWTGNGQDDMSGTVTRADTLGETEWWYLRVIQEDTEMAWSSPVWLDAAR